MKPIDQFIFEVEFAEKQKALLEYVHLADIIFIEPLDMVPRYQSSEPPHYISKEDLYALLASKQPMYMEDGEYCFVKRYNARELKGKFDYEDFLNDRRTQELIGLLDLDKDKFWLLFLFAYDYCWNLCMDGWGFKMPPCEELSHFVKTPYEQTKIMVGKKALVESEEAMEFIQQACREKMEREKQQIDSDPWMLYPQPSGEKTPVSISGCIYCIIYMFQRVFFTLPQVRAKRRAGAKSSNKEKELIGRMIYFSQLSTSTNWLYAVNDILPAYIRQEAKKYHFARKSSVYPEFD